MRWQHQQQQGEVLLQGWAPWGEVLLLGGRAHWREVLLQGAGRYRANPQGG